MKENNYQTLDFETNKVYLQPLNLLQFACNRFQHAQMLML